jgi:hypothetical protein
MSDSPPRNLMGMTGRHVTRVCVLLNDNFRLATLKKIHVLMRMLYTCILLMKPYPGTGLTQACISTPREGRRMRVPEA